jgi:hypothetical protein
VDFQAQHTLSWDANNREIIGKIAAKRKIGKRGKNEKGRGLKKHLF